MEKNKGVMIGAIVVIIVGVAVLAAMLSKPKVDMPDVNETYNDVDITSPVVDENGMDLPILEGGVADDVVSPEELVNTPAVTEGTGEYMTAEEKVTYGIPADKEVEIVQRNPDGSIYMFKIIE